MKEFWVQLFDNLSEKVKKTILTNSKELCSVVVTSKGYINLARSLGFKVASATEGDIYLRIEPSPDELRGLKHEGKPVVVQFDVKSKADEDKLAEAAEIGVEYIIARFPNWKIIPIENLIAKIRGKTKLLAEASSIEEAKLAFEILEFGVDGIVLKSENPDDVAMMVKALKGLGVKSRLQLSDAKVLAVKQLGLGDRVCVDTCELLAEGEGILVGSQSAGLFLVQAEVLQTPHVEPRPFRVNAGPVSLYVLVNNGKTRYLSELKAGEEILIINRNGETHNATVARSKIEKRPLTLVEADVGGNLIRTILQNAETIHLVTKSGSISIRDLKPKDEIRVYYKRGGRHFGILVEEESVIER